MSINKFKTMRHVETVRNYINFTIKKLMHCAEHHDQSKLQSPEAEIFELYTSKLKNTTYDSKEYRQHMKEMKVAIDHHNSINRHHPEYFKNGIKDMTLIDLIEMMCDWKSASMRHHNGDVYKSLEINQKRFGYSDELKQIFKNTISLLESSKIYHHANES